MQCGTGMFPDRASAQAAALQETGFAQKDMVFGSGEKLVGNERVIKDQQSVGNQLLSLSEEAAIIKESSGLAEQGLAVVALRVEESDLAHRAKLPRTLRQHGGRHLH